MLAATWKGRAVAVKVMLASHGEHASELESFRQEVRPSCSDTLVTSLYNGEALTFSTNNLSSRNPAPLYLAQAQSFLSRQSDLKLKPPHPGLLSMSNFRGLVCLLLLPIDARV